MPHVGIAGTACLLFDEKHLTYIDHFESNKENVSSVTANRGKRKQSLQIPRQYLISYHLYSFIYTVLKEVPELLLYLTPFQRTVKTNVAWTRLNPVAIFLS